VAALAEADRRSENIDSCDRLAAITTYISPKVDSPSARARTWDHRLGRPAISRRGPHDFATVDSPTSQPARHKARPDRCRYGLLFVHLLVGRDHFADGGLVLARHWRARTGSFLVCTDPVLADSRLWTLYLLSQRPYGQPFHGGRDDTFEQLHPRHSFSPSSVSKTGTRDWAGVANQSIVTASGGPVQTSNPAVLVSN